MQPGQPTIHVDRALGHALDDFDVNVFDMQRFYEGLPHPNKPDLSELEIVFSATAVTDRNDTHRAETGNMMEHAIYPLNEVYSPEQPRRLKPRATVMLGGVLLHARQSKTDKEMSEICLSEIITHELVHYAQFGAPELWPYPDKKTHDKEKLDDYKNSLKETLCHELQVVRWNHGFKALGASAVAASEMFTAASTTDSLGRGLAVATAGYLLANGKRIIEDTNQCAADMQYKRYLDRAHEVDARAHASGTAVATTLKLRPNYSDYLDKMRVSQEDLGGVHAQLVTRRHRELSLLPPQ
jgi:hypothetical protein